VTKILLIEDDHTFSKILELFLTRRGYSVDVRHDFRSGGVALAENSYDLLLLD
jgi:two-component system, NtrC family, response regulator HydG